MKTSANQKSYWTSIVYGFMIAGVVAIIALMASVPPVSRDALIHHLAIPKLYLRHGGMFEIPAFSFSYYPMNLDLLYLIPLYFKNDIFPKFIHFAFALATAWMVYRYLKRRLNIEYALLGSLFFLSIPVIVNQSTIVYVDLGLVCFLFAALMYLFKWIEYDFKIKYLLISAVFCGFAMGTKYNGLVGLFLLGLFVPLVYARYHAEEQSHARKAIGYSAVYVLIALIIFSPWMIRNTIWTGNPVYPLYNSVFNSGAAHTEAVDEDEHEKGSRMNHFQIRRDLYGESGLEIALIPLRVFFQGRDNDPKYFDGRANPFLLLLPIFAFLGIRTNPRQIKTEKYLMLGFSVFFLLFACAQTVIRIRYFAPIFPPLVILSMFGLRHIQKNLLSRNLQIGAFANRTCIISIIFVMLGLNAKYMMERFSYAQPLAYLSGKVSRDQYIQKFRPEYASMQYANRNLTKNDRILGVYTGNRGYYSDIDMVFSLDLLQDLAAEANTPEDIAEGLKKLGITHLLVNYELFNFWVKNYSLHEKQMLKDFFEKMTVTEFSKDQNGLLKVL
ncbi:MAG: glycosyltransferase family 39 protein [Desulfobacteraceae bacterium]|jgi:4-amino-4-deoxy-L-arabinose transferase-like glycosyltransferase|nr:glycosyltransferase family 39 protein [Desulfobacteraceae bacterium]